MMDEDHTENGHINANGEEEEDTHPDINSPKRYSSNSKTAVVSEDDPAMEYFEHKREGSMTGSEEREELVMHEKDNDSHYSNSYVTVSPSGSPDLNADSSLVDDRNNTKSEPYVYSSGEEVKPKPLPCATKPHPRNRVADMESALSRQHTTSSETGQDVDLKVSINEREKTDVKSEIYIRYKICTETTRPKSQFEESRYEVWRRYKDFEWLREMMEKHHSTLIIPPLPGKQLTRYFDQRSEEFLNERQRALDKFLKRLSAHPYFSFDAHLKMFITATPEDFSSFVSETSGSNRLLGAVTLSVKMAANSFFIKNPDPEYVKELKYFEELGDKLGHMERVTARLHSEREEMASNMEDFSSALNEWSLSEPPVSDAIRQMGTCVENSTSALKLLNENNAYNLMLTAREYQLYCASGVSAVRRRDGLQLSWERSSEEREKKKKVHDECANAGKLQKLPKMADELQKAGIEAERSLDDLSVANERIRVDIEKWREAKNRELCKLMSVAASNHISYHQKCFNEWEVVLSMLRGSKSSTSAAAAAILKDLESSASTNSSPSTPRPTERGVVKGGTKPSDLERSESPDLFT